MPKKILTTKEEKAPFFKGMNALADAVTATLGPAGKQVIISKGWGANVESTKDGYNTALNIQLEDWIEDAGANMIKGVAKKTVEVTGDNTTTATLLCQFMINEGIKAVEEGANTRKVKEGIDKAVDRVLSELTEMSTPVDNNMIRQVATISANNDQFIGDIIGDAYQQAGNKALLLIEESETAKTSIEVIKGAELQGGYINDYCVTDKNKLIAEYIKPITLVFDYEINKLQEIGKVMEGIAVKYQGIENVPIVIFARDFGGEVSSSVKISSQPKPISIGLKCILVKAPSSYQKEFLKDAAAITGAKFVSDSNGGLKPQDCTVDDAGFCEKIIVSNATTTIIGGADINQHVQLIQAEIDNSKSKEFKEVYEKRLAQISGSIGIIKVGGATQVEMKERKDRIDDAVRATKCAIEEGVLPGGGLSFINASNILNCSDGNDNAGERIVFHALSAPLKKMSENAGVEYDKIIKGVGQNKGYNFKTNSFEDLMASGVLDATKVVKMALVNAASVAGQIITSGPFIIETPKKD